MLAAALHLRRETIIAELTRTRRRGDRTRAANLTGRIDQIDEILAMLGETS